MNKRYSQVIAIILCIILTTTNMTVFASGDFISNGEKLKDNIEQEDAYVEVTIEHKLLSGQEGHEEHLPSRSKKSYINLAPGGDTGIKDYLDLGEIEEDIINGKYIYSLKEIVIGELKISSEDYRENKKLEDLGIENNDYNLFSKSSDMKIYYSTEIKDIEKTIEIKLVAEDSYHKKISFEDKLKFNVIYSNENASLDTKYEIENGKIKIAMVDENVIIASGVNEKNYENYTIDLVEKNGNDYSLKLVPNKINRDVDGNFLFGKVDFENDYNKENLKKSIGLNQDDSIVIDGKMVKENMTHSVINRSDKVMDNGDFYYNDEIKLDIDNKKSKLTEVVLGERYETEKIFVDWSEKLTSNVVLGQEKDSIFKFKFDYKRKSYNVKVNDGAVKKYDVMLEDTKELEFVNEKIKSIKIKNGDKEEQILGKKIDLEQLDENSIILIETHEGLSIGEVNYKVKDVNMNSQAFVGERSFKGLEGTKLKLAPIRQHDFKAGDKVILKDHKLMEAEFKDVELKYNLVIDFKFNKNDRPMYKVLHVTKYGDNTAIGGEYKIKSENVNEFKILHEEYIETDFNKSARANPKNLSDKGFELIDSKDLPFSRDGKLINGGEIEGLEGFDVKYVADKVEEKIDGDTVYIYSYKQVENQIGEALKLNIMETLDGEVYTSAILTYPRYNYDYQVTIEGLGSRNTCYANKKVIEYFDSNYGVVKGSSKFEDGNLIFQVKAAQGNPGDWFPRARNMINDYFIGLELRYEDASGNGSTCGKEKLFEEVNLNVKKLSLKEDGNFEELQYPVEKISGLKGYSQDLELLNIGKLTNSKISIGKDNYRYKPYKNSGKTSNDFIGILDENYKQIEGSNGGIFGLDTSEIEFERNREIFVVYEKDLVEVDPVQNYKIKVSEFKVRPEYMKNNISGSDLEFIPKVYEDGSILIKDEARISLHYDKFLESLEHVYKNTIKSLELDIDTHFVVDKLASATDENKEVARLEIEKLINEIKNSKKLGYDDKNKLLYKMEDIRDLNKAKMIKLDDEKISLDNILDKLKNINGESFYTSILNTEYNYVNIINAKDNIISGDKMYTVDYKDYMPKKFIDAHNIKREEAYSATHKYVVTRMEEWSRFPLAVSRNVINNENVEDFVKFGEKFPVGNTKDWTTTEPNIFNVNVEDEINFEIPVVFISRTYDKYVLEKIPGTDIPEEPKETKRDLEVKISFYDENDNLKQEPYLIKYDNLPEYFNSLGWKIESYKNFKYINDEGENLKEGDTKYSERLENNKKVILEIKYKGTGSVPEKPNESDYNYIIFNQDLGSLGDVPKNISTHTSKQKYPVGLSLKYEPEKIAGYKIVRDGKVSDDYSEIDIVIRDEKILGNKANFNYINYVKEENLIKLIFDGDGGKFTNGETSKVYDLQKGDKIGNLEFPVDVSKENNQFKGWFEKEDGQYKEIDKNRQLFKDTTLYAKWEEVVEPVKEAKMKFNANGGKFVEAKEVIEVKAVEGSKIADIKPSNPAKEKNIFKGWGIKGQDGRLTLVEADREIEENLEVFAVWEEVTTSTYIIYDGNGGYFSSNSEINRITGEVGKKISSHNPSEKVRRSGYTFDRWTYDKNGYDKLDDRLLKEGDYIRLYGQWDRNSSGGGGSSKPDPVKPKDSGSKTSTDDKGRELGKLLEARIDFELNEKDHLSYIKGYTDSTVKPENNLTREEAAMVLYRLMAPEYRRELEYRENDFIDVDENRWSDKPISILAKAGMLTGYKDGSFKPTNEITRAELATMIAKLTDVIVLETKFEDIKGHWAEDYINSVQKTGWIQGYEDNTFRPNELIKRSEFVSIINNVLFRKVDKENILPDVKRFKDLEQNRWFYEGMVEAINGHDYELKRLDDSSEKWIKLIDTEYDDL